MQFIFGSDNNNGYELLLADDYQDAGKVVDQIKFPGDAHVDACGFISFGPNSNRPLFFRRKNDTGYSREAYYIHGVYGKPEDGYFLSDRFKQEFFCKFVEQDWVNSKRAGTASAYVPETDTALMARAGEAALISNSVKREILSRLFAGESLVLAVEDSLFSGDYARLLMWELFSYMPQSVIKSTTFITAVVHAPGLRVRILPASLAQTCRDTTICVNNPNHREVEIPQFTQILTGIMRLHDENKPALHRLYADYHVICNGYSANYKPMQFCDFMEAYFGGNPELTYKLLEEYFSVIADPDPDTVPAFIKKNMGEHLPRLEKPKKMRELVDAASFIKNNAVVLKVLYSVDPRMMEKAVIAEYSVIYHMKMTEEGLSILKEALPRYSNRAGERIPAYQRLFYDTADTYIKSVAETVRRCEQLREEVLTNKRAYASHLERMNLSPSRAAVERERFREYNEPVIKMADQQNYQIGPFVDKAFDEILEWHRQRDLLYGDSEGAELVRKLNEALDDRRSGTEAILRDIGVAVQHCRGLTPALQEAVVRFVRNHDQYVQQEVRKWVRDRFADLEGIDIAVIVAAKEEPLKAMDFAASYLKKETAIYTIGQIYSANMALFEGMDPKAFAAYVKSISVNLALQKGTCYPEPVQQKKIDLNPEDFGGKNGARLYKALAAAWKQKPKAQSTREESPREHSSRGYSPRGRGKRRRKSKTFDILFIAAVALAAVAIIVGTVLLVVGTLRNDENTDPTNPTVATDPSDPTDGTDPSDPTDGTDPSNPTEGTDPSNPTEGTEPTQNANE